MRKARHVPVAAVIVAVALPALALIGHGRAEARTPPPAPSTRIAEAYRLRRVLAGYGIGAIGFGQSPVAVISAVTRLLGPASSGYVGYPIPQCGVDHTMTWPNWPTVSVHGRHYAYDPVLTVSFYRSRFVGYQYGEFGTSAAPRAPVQGTVLATTRGLNIGDTLARGNKLYGDEFKLSSAQGGTWNAARLRGFAWGRPSHGDVSPASLVATIDAGNVGCAALSP